MTFVHASFPTMTSLDSCKAHMLISFMIFEHLTTFKVNKQALSHQRERKIGHYRLTLNAMFSTEITQQKLVSINALKAGFSEGYFSIDSESTQTSAVISSSSHSG